MRSETLQLLQATDDPKRCEYREGFDWDAAMRRIQALIPNLERIIGRSLVLDRDVQDASFFTELSLPRPGATTTSVDIVVAVRFSAFGNLFTIWSHSPSEHLPLSVLPRVITALEERGFAFVDAKSLDEPYTGANPLFIGRTWWARFFDYL